MNGRPDGCPAGHPLRWVTEAVAVCACRTSHIWRWEAPKPGWSQRGALRVETNVVARQLAETLRAGSEPAPAQRKGDEAMVLETARGLRVETTSDLNVIGVVPVESPMRERDIPSAPPSDWGWEPEPDAGGWHALTGALTGAFVHDRLHEFEARELVHAAVRKVRLYHARRLAKVFQPAKVGTILVSLRADGTRAVVEGNHRLWVVQREKRLPGFVFRCELYKGLTGAQEAILWEGEEARLRPLPIEKLVGRIQQAEPKAVAIKRALDAHGVGMRGLGPDDTHWPFVEAGLAVERLYDLFGGAVLSAAVGVAIGAWPHYKAALDGTVLMALGYVLHRYADVDRARLVARLEKTTPQHLRAAGAELKALMKVRVSNGLAQCVATAVVGLYNRGLRHRISEWEWVR